ncbi:hypothetical protein ACG755_005279 [Klebsiella variicola]
MNPIEKVRSGITAALLGKTPEQLADEQRKAAVKNAVDDYLIRNPDWKPSHQSASAVAPVSNTKQKAIRIMKTLGAGAGGFTPHEIDPEMLRLARKKCRQVVAENPERYSHIISAPLRA